jgi:hypothetical protein
VPLYVCSRLVNLICRLRELAFAQSYNMNAHGVCLSACTLPDAGGGYEPYDPYDDYSGSEDEYDAEQPAEYAAADCGGHALAAAAGEVTAGSLQAAAVAVAGAAAAMQVRGKLGSSSNSGSKSLAGALQPVQALQPLQAQLLNGSSSSKGGELQGQQQTPAAAAAADDSHSWSISAGCDADHFSGSDGSFSSSSSAEPEEDQQHELDAGSAAGAAWLAASPPAAWLAGAGSYRLALHTSSKHGAGTRTRVSQ